MYSDKSATHSNEKHVRVASLWRLWLVVVPVVLMTWLPSEFAVVRAEDSVGAKLLQRWGQDDSYIGRRTSSMSFSSDGHWLVWTADDVGVGVVDLTREREVEFLPIEAGNARAYCLNDPDEVLVVSTDGKSSDIWNIRERQRLRKLSALPSPFGISASSQRATYFDGQQWCVRDLKTDEVVATLPGIKMAGAVGCVSLSDNGRVLVIGDRLGNVEIWDVTTKQRLWQDSNQAMIERVAYSPNGQTVAITRLDQVVLLFDVEQRAVTSTLNTRFVQGLGFLNGGAELWLATHHDLEVYNLKQAAPVRSAKTFLTTKPWSRQFANVSAVATPRGDIVALDQQGRTCLWDLKKLEPLEPRRWDFQFGFGATFWGDGTRVLHADAEDGWVERDVAQGTIVRQKRSSSRVLLLAAAVDRSAVAIATPKSIEIWPTDADRPRFTFETSSVRRLEFDRDNQSLLGIENYQNPFRRNVATGELLPLKLTHSTTAFRSSEQQTVAVGARSSGTAIYKNDAPQCVFASTALATCVLSDDQVAAAFPNGIKIWNVTTCEEAALLPATISPGGTAPHLDVSPDGHMLAATVAKNSVRVWRLSDRREVARLPTHTAPICALAFSPDGRRLLTACMDSSVRVWGLEGR